MKRAAILLFLLATSTSLFAAGATRRVLVATRNAPDVSMRRMRGDDFDPEDRVRYNVRQFKFINAFAADLDESEIAALRKSPEVALIEDDPERHAFEVTSQADTIIPGQQTTAYGVSLIKAPQAWPITKGRSFDPNKPIRVAIIDSGIDKTSPELAANFKGGTDIINDDNDPTDDNGHGTHVAGLIAAADNGAGVVGVAPQVEIYSVKVLDGCGFGSGSGVIAALDWIRARKQEIGGNWIINLSLGSNKATTIERNAFQAAADAGILIFAASGNDFANFPTAVAFPAGYPSVVAVGAVDSTSVVASFSQRGTAMKLSAPGVSNLSTFVGEQVATNDGRQFQALLVGALNADGTANEDVCVPKPILSGTFVFCGRGNPADFPASVSGKIALIERGDLTFLVKAQNAKAAGAVGVILYNNVPPDPTFGGPGFQVTPSGDFPDTPPTVMLQQADGLALKATPNVTVTINFGLSGFALLSGTSMACPHAVGAAALVWSVSPSSKPADVADALEKTAIDLGNADVDNTYGFGLIDVKAAVDRLNTGNPVEAKPTGRLAGRRGH